MKAKKVLYNIFIKYQGLFVLLVLIDQISKLLAIKYLQTPVTIFSWFKLELSVNSGVAFSLFKDAPQIVSAFISIIATIALEYYIIKHKPKDKFMVVMLIILAAGAFGNGIDRWLAVFGRKINVNGVYYSGVVDFIYPTFFANFNIADSYVTCTCIILLIYFIFSKDDSEPSYKELKEAEKKLNEEKNLESNEDEPLNKDDKNE